MPIMVESVKTDVRQGKLAGACARAWIADLAAEHGGYAALARFAGLGTSWVRFAQDGAVPRRQTIDQLAQVAHPSADVMETVLADVAAFWKDRAAHLRKPVATCLICGGTLKPSSAAKWSSYDPANNTFVHRRCASRITVVCPKCKIPRPRQRWEVQQLRKRGRVSEDANGQIEAWCRPCALLKEGGKSGRASQNEKLVVERAQLIRRTGANTTTDRLLVSLLQTHRLKLENACALMEAKVAKEPEMQSLLASLRTERLLEKLGDGDRDQGARIRSKIIRDAGRRAREERKGRGRLNRRTVTAARLKGSFSLCPLCELLVYRSAEAQPSGRMWHGPCWRTWVKRSEAKSWLSERRMLRSRNVPVELGSDFPIPSPSRGAMPTIENLADSYRMLMAQAAGQGLAEIAREAGISKPAVSMRLASLRDRLPADWRFVFTRPTAGLHTHQAVYPLPLKGLGQQRAAVRMANLGVNEATIQTITGIDFSASAPPTPGATVG